MNKSSAPVRLTGTLALVVGLLAAAPAAAQQQVPTVANGSKGSMKTPPTLVEKAVLGVDGPQEALLYQPASLLFGEDGKVFIPDSGNKAIHVYDRSGKFLYRFGGEGSGPGEFRMPMGLWFNKAGEMVAPDLMNQRTNFYEPDGTFLRSEPMGGGPMRSSSLVDLGGGEFLRSSGGMMIVVAMGERARSSSGEEEEPKLIEIVDEKDEVIRTFGEMKPHEDQRVQRTLNSVVTAAGGGKVAAAYRNTPDIRIYDLKSGRLERIITRELPFTPAEPEMGENRMTGPDGGVRVMMTVRSDVVTRSVAFDPQGRLWTLTYLVNRDGMEKKQEEGDYTGMMRLEVYDRDGELLATLPLDQPSRSIYFDESGDLWMLDSELESSVRRFEVRWP